MLRVKDWGSKKERIYLRATDEEKARWQQAADRERLSLSEWIRATLNKAAQSK